MTGRRRTDAPPVADIEVGAAATMKSIRFDKVPETEVEFPDSDEERSGSHTERENLPEKIEPGVTYRDAKIRWRGGASFRAEVPAELGERLEDEGERK